MVLSCHICVAEATSGSWPTKAPTWDPFGAAAFSCWKTWGMGRG